MSWWDGNCPKLQRCVTHAKCPQWLTLTIRWWYCAVLYGQRSPFLFSAPLLFFSCRLSSLSYTLSASQKNAHFNTLITTPHCAYIMPTHAHTAAERITLTCTRACVTGSGTQRYFSFNPKMKIRNVRRFSTAFLLCGSLFLDPLTHSDNFSPPFSPPFFMYTHMLRQMNINSLNQCSFWAINLICAFYPHCLDVRWQTFVLQCCGKRQHSYASKGLYLERGFVWWRKGGRLRWWGEWRGRER